MVLSSNKRLTRYSSYGNSAIDYNHNISYNYFIWTTFEINTTHRRNKKEPTNQKYFRNWSPLSQLKLHLREIHDRVPDMVRFMILRHLSMQSYLLNPLKIKILEGRSFSSEWSYFVMPWNFLMRQFAVALLLYLLNIFLLLEGVQRCQQLNWFHFRWIKALVEIYIRWTNSDGPLDL